MSSFFTLYRKDDLMHSARSDVVSLGDFGTAQTTFNLTRDFDISLCVLMDFCFVSLSAQMVHVITSGAMCGRNFSATFDNPSSGVNVHKIMPCVVVRRIRHSS